MIFSNVPALSAEAGLPVTCLPSSTDPDLHNPGPFVYLDAVTDLICQVFQELSDAQGNIGTESMGRK